MSPEASWRHGIAPGIAGRVERQSGCSGSSTTIAVPAPGAVDFDRSAQGLHPVAQADQTRTSRGIGAADAVVADRQVQQDVALFDRDLRARRAGVLGRAGSSAAD
jgi:hypothetical protein